MEKNETHRTHESFEQSLRIIAKSCHAKTLEDVKVIVNMLTSVLDIQCAAVLIVERDQDGNPVLVDTLRCDKPNEWLDCYLDRNLIRDDPVVEYALKSNCALVWNNDLLDTLPSARCRQFSRWVKRFGVRGGLVYPFPSQTNSAQSFIFYTQADREKISELALHLAQISTLLQYPGDAITRVYKTQQAAPHEKQCPLTKRELQVLNWAIHGKTSAEIATILSISERTVKFHLSNTYEKMGVINRQQAIAKAIQHELLDAGSLD